MSQERVQKILAQAGIASRRKAEELITQGLVTINGRTAKLGDKADARADAIKVNNKLIQMNEPTIYLAFHKPRSVLTTMSDPEGRPTIKEFLGKVPTRVFPVGRLDCNSDGLLILTNDGDFAEKLQKNDAIPRVYHIKVKGEVNEQAIANLAKGARIERKMVRPMTARVVQNLANKSVVEVVMNKNTSADLRALFTFKGFLVDKMTRVSIGNITLKGIEPGHYRFLKKVHVDALLNTLEPAEYEMPKLERGAVNARRAATRERYHEQRETEKKLSIIKPRTSKFEVKTSSSGRNIIKPKSAKLKIITREKRSR